MKLIIVTGRENSGKRTLCKRLVRTRGYTYIDYETFENTEKAFVCARQNLNLGNDVIIRVPFKEELKDYDKYKNLIKEAQISEDIVIKLVFVHTDKEIFSGEVDKPEEFRAYLKKKGEKEWDINPNFTGYYVYDNYPFNEADTKLYDLNKYLGR